MHKLVFFNSNVLFLTTVFLGGGTSLPIDLIRIEGINLNDPDNLITYKWREISNEEKNVYDRIAICAQSPMDSLRFDVIPSLIHDLMEKKSFLFKLLPSSARHQ